MDTDTATVEAAFARLASDLRIQILETLVDSPDRVPLSFMDLYDAVDTTNTSQFSYHLKQLTDQYVHHTDAGYVVSDAGRRVVQSIKAGEYTRQPTFDPVEVSTHCPYCEATAAEATHDGHLATIDCLSCDNTILRYDLQPGHIEGRDSIHSLQAADRQIRAEFGAAVDGVCLRCGGTVNADLSTGRAADPATALVVCECQCCEVTVSAPVEIAVLHHPEMVTRYWTDDVNVTTTPTWELLTTTADWDVEIADGNTVTITDAEDEKHRFTVASPTGTSASQRGIVHLTHANPQ